VVSFSHLSITTPKASVPSMLCSSLVVHCRPRGGPSTSHQDTLRRARANRFAPISKCGLRELGEMMRFFDRHEAGQQLAARLLDYRDADAVVLALPRGGVPVGYEVAQVLGAPLDVIVARKIGAPDRREDSIGAIGPEGAVVLDSALVARYGADTAQITPIVAEERAELARRERRYRGSRPPAPVAGRVTILVDDGLATGLTAQVVIAVLRARGTGRIVVATPVMAQEAVDRLRPQADALVYLEAPPTFRTVSFWYDDFTPVTDAAVVALLRQSAAGA
jgi:putative phosphoribosyl transferase